MIRCRLISAALLIATTATHICVAQMGGGGMSGGYGGSGGGEMGMGSGGYGGMMGGYSGPLQGLLSDLVENPISWSKPSGPDPSWLTNGQQSVMKEEELRARLNENVELQEGMGFQALSKYLAEEHGIRLLANSSDLENQAINLEEVAKTESLGNSPIRDYLRKMLEPHDLSYAVHEGFVEVASADYFESSPRIRYYDLGFVAQDSTLIPSLVTVITETIAPDSWVQNGGQSTVMPIGRLLVIATSEENHLSVERLLARLAQVNKESQSSFGGMEPGGSTGGMF